MSVYNYLNYKEFLKDTIGHKKATLGRDYSYQKMAGHCRVQKTYLSKVLNHQGDLTEDQLFLAAEFLKLKEEEYQHLFKIYQMNKTSLESRRTSLEKALKKKQSEVQKSEAHIEVETSSASTELVPYFLNPLQQIIHMMLTIERFSKSTKAIQESLHLTPNQLAENLEELERMGLISYHQDRYIVLKNNLHMPSDSPYFKAYLSLLRQKGAQRIDQISTEEKYNFTVLFSCNKKTQKQIHENFLKFLEETKNLVGQSSEEEVYQMNFDLFSWT